MGGVAKGWNLLLVTLDTVRADHLGCYGDPQAETPNLDRLARRGLRFEQAIATVPLTLPSHASILSGTLPPQHGLHGNGAGAIAPRVATLATRLRSFPYQSGAFVGSFVLDHRYGLARGFDHYDDEIDRPAKSPLGLEAERPGRVVVDRALAWLETAAAKRGPFFAWVHLYDAHAPYQPPEPYASRHAGRPYDGEIAEVDHQVGRLLDWLAEHRLEERTVVVVVADHGEALGEHGELTHGFFVYEPTLRVPLLMAAPGRLPAGGVVAEPISLADVAPTLAALLDVPFARLTEGKQLLAALQAGSELPATAIYAETEYPASFGWSPLHALRQGRAKLIQAPSPELYDLAQDPQESHNRYAPGAAIASELTASLARLRSNAVSAEPVAEDADSRARIAALGYLSSSGGANPDPTAPPTGKDPKDTISLFRRFEETVWAASAGRSAEAAAGLGELVAADPENPVFRAALARELRSQGRLGEAIAEYRRATDLAPGDADAWYNLGVALREAGDPRAALGAFLESVKRNVWNLEAVNALAVGLAAAGEPGMAAARLEQVVKIDPRDPQTWNNLGNCRRELGEYPEAIAAYQRAIELAPAFADPWNGLGALEVARDDPRAALPYLDRALSLNPEAHEVRLNRAIAFEMAGERSAAIASYEDFLRATAAASGYDAQRDAARRLLRKLRAAGPPGETGGDRRSPS